MSGKTEIDDYALQLPLATAQELIRTKSIQSVLLQLKDTDQTDAVKTQLESLFRERGWNLEVKCWYDLSDFYLKTKLMFGQFFMIINFVIGFIVILSIYNTLNMSVLGRVGQGRVG